MPSNKRKSQGLHAIRRARERYGLHLTQNDLAQLVRDIQEGRAWLTARQSNRVSHYDMMTRGLTVRVVYDHARHQIVTFLPK